MKRLIALLVGLAVAIPAPVMAQSNNDDFTPLGSRIKRDKQFPLSLPERFDRERTTAVARSRSRMMLNQLAACLYHRSKEASRGLLEKTDFGFISFKQIGLEDDRALRIYGFSDCLSRVASMNSSGVQLRFTPGGMRQWLLQEAYYDDYPDGPDWVKPGFTVSERIYPLSENNPAVHMVMDFADCVVITDPINADFFFRTGENSAEEKEALQGLIPSLGPCLPAGRQMKVSPDLLRVWIGEALWHASKHSVPVEADSSEVPQ